MNETVIVQLTTPEAILFRQFQQYHDDLEVFQVLREQGVFIQKNAVVNLHFDYEGKLKKITRADVMYDDKYAK